MKGQLSAEMLIILAVILAIIALAANQMIGSAKETSENIGMQTKKINEMTNQIKGEEGDFCVVEDDCLQEFNCKNNRCS